MRCKCERLRRKLGLYDGSGMKSEKSKVADPAAEALRAIRVARPMPECTVPFVVEDDPDKQYAEEVKVLGDMGLNPLVPPPQVARVVNESLALWATRPDETDTTFAGAEEVRGGVPENNGVQVPGLAGTTESVTA